MYKIEHFLLFWLGDMRGNIWILVDYIMKHVNVCCSQMEMHGLPCMIQS